MTNQQFNSVVIAGVLQLVWVSTVWLLGGLPWWLALVAWAAGSLLAVGIVCVTNHVYAWRDRTFR